MVDSKIQKKANQRYMILAFRIIADFGATLAIPVVLFVYIGQRLDARFHSGYWMTLIAFLLAALLSGYMIWRKATAYGQEYSSIEKKEEK